MTHSLTESPETAEVSGANGDRSGDHGPRSPHLFGPNSSFDFHFQHPSPPPPSTSTQAICYTKRAPNLTQFCDTCQRNTLPFNYLICVLKYQVRSKSLSPDTQSTLQHHFNTNRGNTVAMAMKRSSSSTSSNSSIHSYSSSSNVRASCYAVNATTASLQGFHYSTTPSSGAGWCS